MLALQLAATYATVVRCTRDPFQHDAALLVQQFTKRTTTPWTCSAADALAWSIVGDAETSLCCPVGPQRHPHHPLHRLSLPVPLLSLPHLHGRPHRAPRQGHHRHRHLLRLPLHQVGHRPARCKHLNRRGSTASPSVEFVGCEIVLTVCVRIY